MNTQVVDVKKMADKKFRFTASFDFNDCITKEVENFDGFTGGVYLVYGNVIRGKSTDAGETITPIRLEKVFTDSTMASNSDPEMIMLLCDLQTKFDIRDYRYTKEMSWDVSGIDGLTPVNLSIYGTSTATEIVVDVAAECGDNSKEISGLGTETTDWIVDGGGTISSVAESSTVSGRYTITGTSFVPGTTTINLAAPADRSDDVLVVSSGEATTTS